MSQVPLWVFPLLAALLYVGFIQSRPREVPAAVVLGIGVGMSIWSLSGVLSAFSAAVLPIGAWFVGMVAAIALGATLLAPHGVRYVAERRKVHIPGSWVPMGLILGIFAVKFGLGFAAGLGAPVTAASGMAVPVALVLGLLSGGFAARAATVWRVSRAAQIAA